MSVNRTASRLWAAFGKWATRGSLAGLGLLVTLPQAACTDNVAPVVLRSLQGSGAVAFVCRGSDGGGLELDACENKDEDHALFGLVTQTITGEVAVVNLSAGSVVDVDPSVPGFSFLPVGENPGAIVSTPGGEATFVTTREVGKPAIFALPTRCIVEPGDDEPRRDLSIWPSCALPTMPGDMQVVIDPPGDDGSLRESCQGDSPAVRAFEGACYADLSRETSPPGRRKLMVALPDWGQLAVIDAQRLIDSWTPGTFEPCDIEALVPLSVDLPADAIEQPLPDDMVVPGCLESPVRHPPPSGSFMPQPAGFDLVDERLFIADRSAPVVHVLDVSDPCAARELAPLLPVSFEDPRRIVTTSRVAVSPKTTDGRRYAYAIDNGDQPGASVMVFDVTADNPVRTPIVRPGSSRLGFDAPDRIRFGSSARDVAFALRDLPLSDPDTGIAVSGISCNPDPESRASSIGARYRPTSDLSSGAGPLKLRGLFGFVMLTSGQIVTIDLEDYDSRCRRPSAVNHADEPDFRGCAGDPENVERYTLDQDPSGTPTVSDEISCRAVEPHRVRSVSYLVTSSNQGVRAPALRGFPRLSSDQGVLVTDQSERGKESPRMLGVDFEAPGGGSAEAIVYVGTAPFSRSDDENTLDLNPNTAERSSLVLPFAEPRAYPSEEDLTATYEGAISGERGSGFLRVVDEQTVLSDASSDFCTRGVQDTLVMRAIGEERFALSGDALERFASRHADYVQITAPLLPSDDRYWETASGERCEYQGESGFNACNAAFGDVEEDTALARERDLRILSAEQDRLVVEPRASADGIHTELFRCCFPGGLNYRLRAGTQWVVFGSQTGFRHDIIAVPEIDEDGQSRFACRRDCNPRKRYFTGRVFEISAVEDCVLEEGGEPCTVGYEPEAAVCVYDASTGGVEPGGPGSECIFESLTARFAIYRGQSAPPDSDEPERGRSQRDMAFSWQMGGGFRPFVISLASGQTSNVLPSSLDFLPQLEQLVVVDGQALGLSLISLDTFGTVAPSPYF